MPSFAQSFDPRTLAALEGLDFKARYLMEGFLSGLHQSPFHGFSVEFSDYRTYQPGDDLRFIDWSIYARSDRLMAVLLHDRLIPVIPAGGGKIGQIAHWGRIIRGLSADVEKRRPAVSSGTAATAPC